MAYVAQPGELQPGEALGITVCTEMPARLKIRLDVHAARIGVSRAVLVRRAVAELLEREERG